MAEESNERSERGAEVGADLAAMIRHMPAVDATRETLQGLQGVWDSLSLLSEMSGTGVDIGGIRSAFAALSTRLVHEIGSQSHHRAAMVQQSKAQVTIDILVRNLFERTADIGFLATDDDLRRFAQADETGRAALEPALRQRLREYQRKYSVYDDIILLAPDGRVLARLDDSVGLERTRDRALLDEALQTTQPYVEVYRPVDLLPAHPRSLVYACRVMDAAGRTPLGVLCLSFRFEDECQRIFRKFVGVNDWSVVALLDADGRAIASSDSFQVPLGAQVAAPDDGRSHTLRFAGRRWLAVSCAAQPFQGYAGPGWRGHAMTPLEHAFELDDGEADEALDPATAAQLQGSRVLYPDGLRGIADAAHRIEADLARAVWNGNLALLAPAAGGAEAANHTGFSRSLLREIGRTGARMRDGFTQALAQMSRSVLAATREGARQRAALVSDIMDRSLYERANDCRWWALSSAFRQALESPETADRSALERMLQTIHGLYTVYANLLLFDREGRIVAVSRTEGAAAASERIASEWVGRTLALRDTQGYCVSAFEASPLYGGRPTYVYTAAVRGLADASRVVGGMAIVFDSEPQFRSMLQDTLPRNACGTPLDGAFSAFVDRDGRVIACSHDEPAVGAALDTNAELRRAVARGARVACWRGRWYTVGAAASAGYREFKGRDDPYREEVTALVFEAMTDAADASTVEAAAAATVPSQPQLASGRDGVAAGERVDLATFRIDGQWHALAGRDVLEAIPADRLLPLPGSPRHVLGSVMFRDTPIAVLEAGTLLGDAGPQRRSSTGQIIVLRPQNGRGRSFGLRVDALGDNPVVCRSQLVPLQGLGPRGRAGPALIDTLVTAAPGATDRDPVTLLSSEALGRLLTA